MKVEVDDESRYDRAVVAKANMGKNDFQLTILKNFCTTMIYTGTTMTITLCSLSFTRREFLHTKSFSLAGLQHAGDVSNDFR